MKKWKVISSRTSGGSYSVHRDLSKKEALVLAMKHIGKDRIVRLIKNDVLICECMGGSVHNAHKL